jgi:hypothetical protein
LHADIQGALTIAVLTPCQPRGLGGQKIGVATPLPEGLIEAGHVLRSAFAVDVAATQAIVLEDQRPRYRDIGRSTANVVGAVIKPRHCSLIPPPLVRRLL